MLGFYSVAPHSKEIKKPSDLFKLDGDFVGERKTVKITRLDGSKPSARKQGNTQDS